MPSSGSIHADLNWAKERIDEMDAALASLESKAGEVQADARGMTCPVLAQSCRRSMSALLPVSGDIGP